MNKIWTKKWKSVLIWICAYLNFIAYALVGGYVIFKTEDEELQRTAKNAFWVTIIFAAISAFFSLFNYVAGLTDNYYSSDAYEFYSVCTTLVNIARIVVYAVCVVLTFLKKDKIEPPVNDESGDGKDGE